VHRKSGPCFKREVLAAADATNLKWLVIDMLPVTLIDATGIYAVDELIGILHDRSISLVAAGRKQEWKAWSESHNFKLESSGARIFHTLTDAVKAYKEEMASATVA